MVRTVCEIITVSSLDINIDEIPMTRCPISNLFKTAKSQIFNLISAEILVVEDSRPAILARSNQYLQVASDLLKLLILVSLRIDKYGSA